MVCEKSDGVIHEVFDIEWSHRSGEGLSAFLYEPLQDKYSKYPLLMTWRYDKYIFNQVI